MGKPLACWHALDETRSVSDELQLCRWACLPRTPVNNFVPHVRKCMPAQSTAARYSSHTAYARRRCADIYTYESDSRVNEHHTMQARHRTAEHWRQGLTGPFCCFCTAGLPRRQPQSSCQLIPLERNQPRWAFPLLLPSLAHVRSSMLDHRSSAAQTALYVLRENLLTCCSRKLPLGAVSTITFASACMDALAGRPDSKTGCMLQVAFTISAAAVAAIQATRAAAEGQPPARDILVLHPRGRLSLYIGARHVCDVSVRASAPPNMDGPLNRLLPPAPAGISVPLLLQHHLTIWLHHTVLQWGQGPLEVPLYSCTFSMGLTKGLWP